MRDAFRDPGIGFFADGNDTRADGSPMSFAFATPMTP
jgi:hypothetical protein